MSLTTINPGEEADATILMDNFNSLQSDITTTNNRIGTTYAGLETRITNLNTLVNNNRSLEQSDISGVYSTMGSNGLYVTTNFNTSTGAWYREFFSNSSKTNRVWLETGGTYTSDATTNRAIIDNYVLTFPKSFKNDKFHFHRDVQIVSNTGDFNNRFIMYNEKNYGYVTGHEAEGQISSVKLDIAQYALSHYFTYYACGV